jgi:hypothetical protein
MEREVPVVAAVLLLLLIAVLFGVGLAAKAAAWLLWIALLLAMLWIAGWFIGAGTGVGRRRWYYW